MRAALSFRDDGKFCIDAGPRDVDLLRLIPGVTVDRKSGANKWTCEATWGAALALRATFGESLVVHSDVDAWGVEQVWREQMFAALRACGDITEAPEAFAALVSRVASWRE